MTQSSAAHSAILIHSPTSRQAEALADQLVRIYRAAFCAPPYHKEEAEVLDLAHSLPQHVAREGFRLVTAAEIQTDQVVGFAYGYAYAPEQTCHAAVAPALPPQTAAE